MVTRFVNFLPYTPPIHNDNPCRDDGWRVVVGREMKDTKTKHEMHSLFVF